ncbi:MAG: NAD(P)H-hydrate dehydratase [Sulfurovum sp.]
MQNLHKSTYPLDKRCYSKYALTEDILMENASLGMANYIKTNFTKDSSVLIVAGFGNNGADGIVLARHLFGFCIVHLYLPFGVKSDMAKLQLARVQKMYIPIIEEMKEADIIVDCLFGAGLSRALDSQSKRLISDLNTMSGFKIACDIPSGIDVDGNASPVAFIADVTITMGALKESLYSDMSKDFVGDVICVDLGVTRTMYEMATDTYMLEKSDMVLPSRNIRNTHKGTYGHLAVIAGEKEGASILSAMASLRFGVGLVTLVGEVKSALPYSVMQNKRLPYKTSAIALGMGFGDDWSDIDEILDSSLPIILDADIFHHSIIEKFLAQTDRTIVITPHPREFVSLWNYFFGELDIITLQKHRLYYTREFCKVYPHITLLLKGSNTIIAQDQKCFINPHGTAKLSKGGSGDVLSGLIGALLAQGYTSLEATIQASLAFTTCGEAYKGSSYALLPTDLIEEVGKLEASFE